MIANVMIIWLASYPRSGNTLLRMMPNQVFGCKTYTKYYRPPAASDGTLTIHDATATASLEGAWPEAYARMTKSEEVCLVKTHDPPEDSAKAVYVARNGFAAVSSYQCYLRDLKHTNCSLEEIILGRPRFGSWGYHLDVWQPLDRPNTLLLTYEDLVRKPEQQIAKLSEFCGLHPEKSWTNEFDRFHALHPAFFRKAQMGDASAEFSKTEQDLFWSLHGDWMHRLGYATDAWNSTNALSKLRKSLIDYTRSPGVVHANSGTKGSSVRRAIARVFRKARMNL